MNMTKMEFLRLIDSLTDDEMRIVYTFIEELRIAEAYRFTKESVENASKHNSH